MQLRWLSLLLFVGATLAGQDLPMRQAAREVSLGRQIAADIRKETTPVESATIQAWVNHLGQRIAAQLPANDFIFTFSVIAGDSCPPLHEPTTSPDGSLFIPATLFLTARSEAEFAGMLAHAMLHVVKHHGMRPVSSGRTGNGAPLPLIFVGGLGANCLFPQGLLAQKRREEQEADTLAVGTLARAGFDPGALVNYIDRVQTPATTGQARKFSFLPDRRQRIADLSSQIRELPGAKYAPVNSEEFTIVQAEIRTITEPKTRSQDVRSKNSPSLGP